MGNYQEIVKTLELEPHPEGGFFKETYRSKGVISSSELEGFEGERNYATAIYFLLVGDNFSAFHRIKSDETWHFYTGDPIVIHEINPGGKYIKTILSNDISNGFSPQYTVRAGNWFGSEVLNRKGFCLVGCTVSPGFDFRDFEMAERERLINEFPEFSDEIRNLTR